MCGCKGVQTVSSSLNKNHYGNKCKTQGADDSLLKFPHGSHCLVRRNSACVLPNNPAIQEAASPELGSWVPRLEARLRSLLLMRSAWTGDRLCILKAESKQGRHDALFLLPASKPAPKCQSWLQGLEKHLLPASAPRAGTTDTSPDKSLCPDRMENSRLGRAGMTAIWRRQIKPGKLQSALQLCTTHCFSVELCGTLCPRVPTAAGSL